MGSSWLWRSRNVWYLPMMTLARLLNIMISNHLNRYCMRILEMSLVIIVGVGIWGGVWLGGIKKMKKVIKELSFESIVKIFKSYLSFSQSTAN